MSQSRTRVFSPLPPASPPALTFATSSSKFQLLDHTSLLWIHEQKKWFQQNLLNSYYVVGTMLDIEILRTHCPSHLLSDIRESRFRLHSGWPASYSRWASEGGILGGWLNRSLSSDFQRGSFGNGNLSEVLTYINQAHRKLMYKPECQLSIFPGGLYQLMVIVV